MSYKYDKTYKHMIGEKGLLRKLIIQKRLDSISKEVKIWKNKKILDVGCSGGMLQYFLTNHGSEVYGLDINDFVLTTTDFKGKYICGNAMRIPLKSNGFDIVICSHVLEHLPYMYRCVKEMNRVSKPGAKIFILYPIELFRGVTCIPDVLISGQRLSLIRRIHLHKLSLDKLKNLLKGTNLTISKHKLIFALQPMYMAILKKQTY